MASSYSCICLAVLIRGEKTVGMQFVAAMTFRTFYTSIWVADNAGHLDKNGGKDTNSASTLGPKNCLRIQFRARRKLPVSFTSKANQLS